MVAELNGVIRAPQEAEDEPIRSVWQRSYPTDQADSEDDGWIPTPTWSTDSRVLVSGGDVVGLAAIRVDDGSDATIARVALVPERRTSASARALVEETVALTRGAHVPRVWLFADGGATWLHNAASEVGFQYLRSIYEMLRPANAEVPRSRDVPGLAIRSIRDGEDLAVLDALNRAWADTWDFQPIKIEQIQRDLTGQREGMLLGVDASDDSKIVATCHAIWDPERRNADGGPRAWISNLTTDPDWRGRGVGRRMLVAGLQHLYAKGATSIGLGVDGGNETPFGLYRSMGFEVIAATQIWEREAHD